MPETPVRAADLPIKQQMPAWEEHNRLHPLVPETPVRAADLPIKQQMPAWEEYNRLHPVVPETPVRAAKHNLPVIRTPMQPLKKLQPSAPKGIKEKTKRTIAENQKLLSSFREINQRYKELLGCNDVSLSMTDFELANGLARQTVSRLFKKESVMAQMPQASVFVRYNTRHDVRPFYPLEVVLVRLVREFRNRHIPVGQQLLRTMAQEVYALLSSRVGQLSFEEPAFSRSWMNSFKKAWGLNYHEMRGEAGSVVLATIAPQIEVISSVIATYSLENVYNADETGLFLQTMPNWTLDFEKRPGDKQTSSRVSILFCTNATGTDKRKPFILSMPLCAIVSAQSCTSFLVG
jgi:hypothetical protein